MEKTKKLLFAAKLFLLPAAVLFLASCGSLKTENPSGAGRRVPAKKIGLYSDEGCAGNGVAFLARFAARSPQYELVLLDRSDMRPEVLEKLDVFVSPGGGSAKQLKSMGEAGRKALKEYIEKGGNYLGFCAGCYNTLSRKDRLELLPFDWLPNASGKTAVLPVDVNKRGGEVLGIKEGRYYARYSGGPVMRKGKETGKGRGEALAVFKNSIGKPDRAPASFLDTPAMIFGNYGKGKVLGVSFHPEYLEISSVLTAGCFYALTGVKPVPVIPERSFRCCRAGYLTSYRAGLGKNGIKNMLELDKEKDIDVQFVMGAELEAGILHHLDVLLLPDGPEKGYKTVCGGGNAFFRKEILAFLDRGGKVLACKTAAKFLPAHKNLLVVEDDASFASRIRELR